MTTKVLFSIGNLNIGGAEKLVLNQLENIDNKKFDVYFCTLFPDLSGNNYRNFLTLPKDHAKTFNFSGPYDIFSWIKIIMWLRRERFDVICSHLFESNFIIRVACLFRKPKAIFVFEHNIYWQKAKWKILFDHLLAKMTTKIFVDSNAIRDFTAKQENIPLDMFSIVPYPIEMIDEPTDNSSEIKKSFNLPENSFIIGTVGRFVEQKGLTDLIKAARIVIGSTSKKNIYFLIIGYGPLENNLKQLVLDLGLQERVIIGKTRNIREVLPIIDIYTISSLWEGQPIAMLEAMAAGCPIVATRAGGVPEAIRDRENGLLSPVGDVNCLAHQINYLIDNSEQRLKFSKAGKETVRQYGLPIYIKKLESFFEEALIK